MLKVSSRSNPNSVAGALAGVLRERGEAEIQAIGAGAINQAVKAIAIARGFVAPSGKDIVCVIIFTCTIFVERVVGYETGFIQSDIQIYRIPTLIWTGIFGIVIGLSYVILAPIHQNKAVFKITILTVGVNWIIFNSFIGMILADTILVMLKRSIIDVITMYLTGILVNRLIIKGESRKVSVSNL